jgi:hypothetical protein
MTLLSNVLALLGLGMVDEAIANLAGPWWALLFAGLIVVWVAYVVQITSGGTAPATTEVKKS